MPAYSYRLTLVSLLALASLPLLLTFLFLLLTLWLLAFFTVVVDGVSIAPSYLAFKVAKFSKILKK
jgi:hypothetical protein